MSEIVVSSEAENIRSAEFDAAEGFPAKDSIVMQKFLAGRAALIAEEEKQRSDYEFRTRLSPVGRKACEIVEKIRAHEQATLWTDEYEASLAREAEVSIYPGMMFNLAKERMEKSTVWKIVKKLPKGALLHCHLPAMVDLDWLIRLSLTDESSGTLYFTSQDNVLMSEKDRLTADIRFVRLPTKPIVGLADDESQPADKLEATRLGASIWTAGYLPGTPVPALYAAQSFPDGGFDGFVSWLLTRTTITAEESLKHHEGVNEIWRKFESTFGIVDDMIFCERIYRKFLFKFFSELMDDGVQWVDIRANFCQPFLREGKTVHDTDFVGMFEVFGDVIKEFQATEKGKDFWGARFIWTSVRSWDKFMIVKTMKDCVHVKTHFPELIAGFDFVGQEELGRPLYDLASEIFWFQKYCAENGVYLPFFFHAGETNESGGDTDNNLFDAILLGTRRIGHGFSLFKHPLLLDLVKERKILIESCPISNEVLRLTSSILSHPLPALLAKGVSTALCNDDPAILGQGVSGMTHDFWQALQGWNNLGLAGLGSLAENSVRWAPFVDEDPKEWKAVLELGTSGNGVKAARLREWEQKFEDFCAWIVQTYEKEWL